MCRLYFYLHISQNRVIEVTHSELTFKLPSWEYEFSLFLQTYCNVETAKMGLNFVLYTIYIVTKQLTKTVT
jgi:hypothetical protein